MAGWRLDVLGENICAELLRNYSGGIELNKKCTFGILLMNQKEDNNMLEENKVLKYTVEFIGGDGGHAINLSGREIGVEDVARVRKFMETEIPLDAFHDRIDPLKDDVLIDVPEETANKLAAFKKKNGVSVNVSDGFLNDFTPETVYSLRDTVTGVPCTGRVHYVVNKDSILERWIEAGCPLYWA